MATGEGAVSGLVRSEPRRSRAHWRKVSPRTVPQGQGLSSELEAWQDLPHASLPPGELQRILGCWHP